MEKGSAVKRDPACNCPQTSGGPVVWRALGGACSPILALTVAAGCSESPVDAPDSGEELLAPQAAAMSQGQGKGLGSGKGNEQGRGVTFTPKPGEEKFFGAEFRADDGEPLYRCEITYTVPRTAREGHIHVYPNDVFFFRATHSPVQQVRILRREAGAENFTYETPGDDAGTWRGELWFEPHPTRPGSDVWLSGSFTWSGQVVNRNDADDVRQGTCEATLTAGGWYARATFSVTPSP